MARARQRHEQLDMLNGAGTRVWRDPGKRARVRARRATESRRKPGRPKKPGAGSPHKRRASFKASCPVHVVLRVCPEVVAALGTLRRGGGEDLGGEEAGVDAHAVGLVAVGEGRPVGRG